MNHHFDLLRITRRNLLGVARSFSMDALNEIPEGFNNNIAWNVGHVVVTQQLLCYGLSGLKTEVNATMIEKYRKGSKPLGPINQSEWEEIVRLMGSLVDQTQKDLEEGLFKEYKEYTTSYGVTLRSVEEAIIFNNLHESMHLGTVLALKRLV